MVAFIKIMSVSSLPCMEQTWHFTRGMLMFVYIKKERQDCMFQINLQSSDLSKTKQIFYHRTSQSLKNKDLLSEPPKGEFDM